MRNLFRLGIVAAVLASLAAPAQAGNHRRVIKPSQLVPARNLQASSREAALVRGSAAGWSDFYAVVRIPPGKVLTGLGFDHYSTSGNTLVELARVRRAPTPTRQKVYTAIGWGATGSWTAVKGTPVLGVSRKVARGWQYFVLVSLQDSTTYVRDIRVTWRD